METGPDIWTFVDKGIYSIKFNILYVNIPMKSMVNNGFLHRSHCSAPSAP